MMTDLNDLPTAMSTSALELKLRDLREKSNKHSQILTAKLASSQSGLNLLHIGTSLSSLPPDLHSLLTQLHPVLSAAESTEKQYLQHLQRLVQCGNEIRMEQRRVDHARECANQYQDLLAAEWVVKRDASYRRNNTGLATTTLTTSKDQDDDDNGVNAIFGK
jgi:conserved oligomeric Golgi complex subunit 2